MEKKKMVRKEDEIFEKVKKLDTSTLAHASGTFNENGDLEEISLYMSNNKDISMHMVMMFLKHLFSLVPSEKWPEQLQELTDRWTLEMEDNHKLFLYTEDDVNENINQEIELRTAKLREENRKLRITVENLQEAISLLSNKPESGPES